MEEHINLFKKVSMALNDRESTSVSDHHSSCEFSYYDMEKFKNLTRNGMLIRLEEDRENNLDLDKDETRVFEIQSFRSLSCHFSRSNVNTREHSVIKKSFLVGMGLLGKEINVVSIHKNLYSTLTGKARMESFRVFSQAVAEKCGGNANIKYAWYGGSIDEICEIISHGFSTNIGKFSSHGIGSVHLSPINVPFDSVSRAVEDENGLTHILLCRVILGNTEVIPADSKQYQPSSCHFDSGIDDPLTPRKYIIWSSYMNSHIFPNYILSFKACNSFPGYCKIGSSVMKPNSASNRTNFPVLFNKLSKFLQPTKMKLILKFYNDFRENKIQRFQLIRRLRSLVGDSLLISVIKLCRHEEKDSFKKN